MEKPFKKLAAENGILKNYFLDFNRMSSSLAPDRALLGEGLVHCG